MPVNKEMLKANRTYRYTLDDISIDRYIPHDLPSLVKTCLVVEKYTMYRKFNIFGELPIKSKLSRILDTQNTVEKFLVPFSFDQENK